MTLRAGSVKPTRPGWFRPSWRMRPGLAPALRGIWQHLLETHGGNSNECGLGAAPKGERPGHDSAA